MDKFASFISTLMGSRTQAHIFHLQTPSFAAHMALQGYYEGIIPLIDGLVESFQGRNGILRGYALSPLVKEDDSAVQYFEALCKYVESVRISLPQDSYIQNQIDTVVELIESTKYKLKNLK